MTVLVCQFCGKTAFGVNLVNLSGEPHRLTGYDKTVVIAHCQ